MTCARRSAGQHDIGEPLTYRMTKTAAIAATAVAAGLGITACGGGTTTGAHSASFATQTRTTASATPSSSTTTKTPKATPSTSRTHTKKAHHSATVRVTAKKVSRDEARPTVTTRFVTGTSSIAFHTVRTYDSTLAAGSSRVQRAGVAGLATLTYRQQLIGTRISTSTVVKRVVTRQPVDRVLVIGTKKAAPAPQPTPKPTATSTAGLDLSRSAMWDRIAQCESGGNWHINTGNGYYGGLQFSYSTWLAYGGGSFASRADLASRAQQITIANHVYNASGLGAWGCAGAA